MGGRSLRVAAVQMQSENGERTANLERAARLVQQAAAAGAQLIVLPELFSGGYWLNEKSWDTAEPQDGPTEAWLRETARRHGFYLGGSYLQARGEHFFNLFVLATPGGQIAGRIPKQRPASAEAYLFRGEVSSHIIDTELGRIGVGICYDNAFRFLADAMIAGDADIVLMPHSAPTPQQRWYYPKSRVEAFLASYRHGAKNCARRLGVPAILVNKTGAWKSEFPGVLPSHDSRYHGQSEIADSTGETVAELADEESILVAEVAMDPARKLRRLPHEAIKYGRWIGPVPWEFKSFWIIEALGRRSYNTNRHRREKARAVSGNNGRQ